MKVSTEGPSCMAVAVACHNRVMIELYDCQTEDIKVIHMIEKDERDSLMSSHMLGTQRWLTPFKKKQRNFSVYFLIKTSTPKTLKFLLILDLVILVSR